jgi:hypothetical protein
MIHPLAQQSGINIVPSVNQPIFDMQVHVKNSDPSGNSDVDVTFMFWNIWHVRDGSPTQGSTLIPLHASDFVFVPSSIQDPQQLHNGEPGTVGFSTYRLPTVPAGADGHWLHLPARADGLDWVFHLDGGPGSQYYATFLNTAHLGIEHVPEPTGIILLGTGLACSVFGTWCRWRRRSVK